LLTPNQSRYFLIGDIGTGKTTFLNYIFSRHYEQLNKRKIFWVRVDLTKSYHYDNSLDESLNYQLSKIVRKDYLDIRDISKNDENNSTKNLICVKSLINEIEKQFSLLLASERITKKEVDLHINDYLGKYNKQRTKPFHHLVQEGIRKYVETHYSMIYIYDGLDRLRKGKGFEEKLKDIQKYILGSEKSKHLYIFVMRTTSHAQWLDNFWEGEEHHESLLRNVSASFKIIPPKLNKVIEKRITVLCRHWDSILLSEKRNIIKNDIKEDADEDLNYEELQEIIHKYKWINPDDIKSYYHIFLMFIYRGLTLSEKTEVFSSDWSYSKSYSALKDVVGGNFRILLKVLSILHECFLQTIQMYGIDPYSVTNIANMMDNNNADFKNDDLNLILSKHYRVVSYLLRERSVYIHPNEYILDDKGKISTYPVVKGDRTSFIFSIFKGANIIDKNKETYHLLSKIRILQYVQNNAPSRKEEIINYISSNFGYLPENLRIDLKELLCMSIISQVVTDQTFLYKYKISRVGNQYITKLINELSYIRIVLDDIFVPTAIINEFNRRERYSYKKEPLLWTLEQVPRIVRLLFVINVIEKQELLYFKQKNDPAIYQAEWAITNFLKNSIINTIRRIINFSEKLPFDEINKIFSSI